MEHTVYIDLYFMINFAMDFLCFYLTSWLLSLRRSLLRTMLASAFGALYACVALLVGMRGVWSILADLAICLIMCAIAYYRPKEARAVAVDALVYSAVSILLGGAMTALFYFFNRIGLDRLLGSEEDADGVSVWLFALIAIAGAIGTALSGRLMRKKATRRACRVSITLGGRTVTLDGICDSGNLLCEPISALPCIIIDPEYLDKLVGRGDARAVIDRRIEDLSEGICRRVRVIPMRTVGGESVGYGIRADRVRVGLGRETRSVEAFILAANEPISADGARALVPSELL